MATFKSVFGKYAEKLQSVVDASKDKFAPLWYPKYFTMGAPQPTLTYTSVIGRSRIEAAASIIARGSESPLRSRAALEKLSGEIPAIAEKFKMDENDLRTFIMMQQTSLPEGTLKQQILNYIWNDTKKAGDSVHKRIDYLVLEGLSTGQVTITVDNNPDGIAQATPVNLLLDSTHKVNAAVNWATTATATPITDIEGVVQAAKNVGRSFSKILMTNAAWAKFKKTKEVIDNLTGYFMLTKGSLVPTLAKTNEYLRDNLLPEIELVDVSIGIEKNGIITAANPWNDNNVTFVPAGPLGEIKNALSIEQVKPVDNVSYALFNNALISKWNENEPFAEWTKSEFNAFPAFEAIDGIWILSTNVAF